MAYELSDSITINASPSAVFNLLKDITRTGEWSAQCYRAHWNEVPRVLFLGICLDFHY
ncbi:hypothetical protein ACWIB8_11850 [Corynebacterium flavescens]